MTTEPVVAKKWDKSTIILITVGCLCVLCVIAGMLLPAGCQAREKARRINCAGNLKQIGLAIIIYAGDDVTDEMLPSGTNLGLLNTGSYLTDGKVFSCPSAEKPNTLATETNYIYCGAGLSTKNSKAAQIVIAYDRDNNHSNWRNFLFLDGHVKGTKVLSPEDLDNACEEQEWILPPHQR